MIIINQHISAHNYIERKMNGNTQVVVLFIAAD